MTRNITLKSCDIGIQHLRTLVHFNNFPTDKISLGYKCSKRIIWITLGSWGMKWPIYIVVLLLVQIQWDIEIRHYQAKSRDPGDLGHFEPLKPDQSLSSHTGLGKTLLNVVVIASLTSVISWEEVQYNFAKVETLPRKCSKRVYIKKNSLHPKWHLWACQCVPNRNRAFPSARAY